MIELLVFGVLLLLLDSFLLILLEVIIKYRAKCKACTGILMKHPTLVELSIQIPLISGMVLISLSRYIVPHSVPGIGAALVLLPLIFLVPFVYALHRRLIAGRDDVIEYSESPYYGTMHTSISDKKDWFFITTWMISFFLFLSAIELYEVPGRQTVRESMAVLGLAGLILFTSPMLSSTFYGNKGQ